jgi:hypothetical protein
MYNFSLGKLIPFMLPKAELSFCICLRFSLHEKAVMYHVEQEQEQYKNRETKKKCLRPNPVESTTTLHNLNLVALATKNGNQLEQQCKTGYKTQRSSSSSEMCISSAFASATSGTGASSLSSEWTAVFVAATKASPRPALACFSTAAIGSAAAELADA